MSKNTPLQNPSRAEQELGPDVSKQEQNNQDFLCFSGEWNFAKQLFGSVHFLDIIFWFDLEGQLQTDLYVKPTDARTFLNFNSCHP